MMRSRDLRLRWCDASSPHEPRTSLRRTLPALLLLAELLVSPGARADSLTQAPRVSQGVPATLPTPTRLAAPQRPSALLLRGDGTILVGEAQHQVLRLRVAPLPPPTPNALSRPLAPFEAQWSPARSPPRIVDADSDTFLATDENGERLVRVYPGQGGAEDLASGQGITNFVRHGQHVYFLSRGAPQVRRVLLRPPAPSGRAPVRVPDPIEPLAFLPAALSDLAVIAESSGPAVLVTNQTQNSLQRIRPSLPPETLFTFPQAPTRIIASDNTAFVGTRAGGVYRVDLRNGQVQRLAQLSADVTALLQHRCHLLVGTATELVAIGAETGGSIPLARNVQVTAIASSADQILFTNQRENDLLALPAPTCPAAPSGTAPPIVQSAAPPARAVEPPYQDTDLLARRSRSSQHTILIRLQSDRDDLARRIVRGRVQQVLGEVQDEVWARATDAQISSLNADGFLVWYRDGVDRVGCADIRLDPQAGRGSLPPPFYEASTANVYLAQLDVAIHVVPGLQDDLAGRGLTLLESQGATLTLSGSRAALAGLARLPHVRWTAPYGVRDRLLGLAMSLLNQQSPCEEGSTDPQQADNTGSSRASDRTLRALAAWIRQDPKAEIQLSAVFFASSPGFRKVVRSVGGTLLDKDSGDDTIISLRIPRHALPTLAAQAALRTLEPYAEATIAGPDVLGEGAPGRRATPQRGPAITVPTPARPR